MKESNSMSSKSLGRDANPLIPHGRLQTHSTPVHLPGDARSNILIANLPEADANKIRTLSAGIRRRPLIRNEEEEDPPQDFMPEEGEICTKIKEVPTAGLESSLLEPEEMSEGEFEKMTEDDLEEQYFTGVPDRTTWKKIRKLCSPVKTVKGWWDGQKEKVDAKDGELPWEMYCQPRSEEFDSLTKDICIKTFGQGKLYANDPNYP